MVGDRAGMEVKDAICVCGRSVRFVYGGRSVRPKVLLVRNEFRRELLLVWKEGVEGGIAWI